MTAGWLGFGSIEARMDDQALFSRWLLTRSIAREWPGLAGMEFLCNLCGAMVRIAGGSTTGAANEGDVDFREGVNCTQCGMSARLRSCVSTLGQVAGPADRVYITEQATPLFAWMQGRYANVRGSEFAPDAERREQMTAYLHSIGGRGEVEFQDVTRLRMPDASLDAVGCFDVLEHVPDFKAALAEFARVLRPGGALVATFPFTDAADTIIRASLAPGGITHHLEPEYHGDPLGGAVLCFQHFGWDVVLEAKRAGFSRVDMVMPWAPEHGIFYGNWTLLGSR